MDRGPRFDDVAVPTGLELHRHRQRVDDVPPEGLPRAGGFQGARFWGVLVIHVYTNSNYLRTRTIYYTKKD